MATRYKVVDTFFHEIGHAIFWVYGVQDDDKEERVISALGMAYAALFRDNPWIVDWLRSAEL